MARHWQSGPGGGCGSCGDTWPCVFMRLATAKIKLHKIRLETDKYGDLNLARDIRTIIDEGE